MDEIRIKKASEVPDFAQAEEPKIPHNGRIPALQCRAHNRTGAQCKRMCSPGFHVCQTHGGSAPQVIAKAKRRIAALSDPAVEVYQRVLESDDAPCALCGRGYVTPMKLRAAQTIMDRTGLGPTVKLEHSGEISHEVIISKMTEDELSAVDEIMERVMERVAAEQGEDGD